VRLNSKQKKAVEHKSGPLLIVAGAGTGKTTVITERIRYLVEKRQVSPSKILALTFTDKSANEMLERLDRTMPLGYEEPWLGTFHSVGDRLLRAEGLEMGLDPAYKILSKTDQWMFIREHLFDFDLDYYRPLGNPNKFINALMTFFSRCQDEDVSSQRLSAFALGKGHNAERKVNKENTKKLVELAKAYEKYEEFKIQESVMDFGDLITKSLELLRKRPALLAKYREQFEHVLVDEFQDTNYAQYQLVKMLTPSRQKPNLVVVGDDDQSVYRFRGAAISNILDFKRDYPNSSEVVLTTNYRSVQPILDGAYKLIVNNNPDRLEVKLKIEKKLKSGNLKPPKEKPSVVSLESEQDEVNYAVTKILELVARENFSYKDFAILTRSNAQLEPYITALKQSSIPYQVVANRGLFDQEEVRNLIYFLRVLSDPSDNLSLFGLLTLPEFDLPSERVFELLAESKRLRVAVWELLKKSDKGDEVDLVNMIKRHQKLALNESVTKVIHAFVLESNILKRLASDESLENKLKIKNLNLFLDRIKRFETVNRPAKVVDFVETLALWEEAGDNPAQAVIEDIDTVNLMSIHAAKGLEFEVVFVGSIVAGRFPAINRRDPIEFPEELIKERLPVGSGFLEEERRLMYVAMTRARKYLYLTYASDYGGVRKRKPSGFLAETGLEVVGAPFDSTQGKQVALGNLTTSSKKSIPLYLSKEGVVEISSVSYSQIETFDTCPLKYKYRYILRVPAEPHHSLSFGQTMHTTLYEFHLLEKQSKKPTLKRLLGMYEKNFIELGYDSETHKKKRFEAGKTALKRYYKDLGKIFGKPKFLEKKFRLNLGGIPLIGKIDRIDESEDGVEIVDYKTGSAKDEKQVARDKQLTIYGLAAKEALGVEVDKFSLYFLESGKKVTTTRNDSDYEKVRRDLEDKVGVIKKSNFGAKPNYPFPCKFCEYNKICPFASRD